MKLINNGLKYFSNFGKYCHFSANVMDGSSVAIALATVPPSINDAVDAVDAVLDGDEFMAFDSLMNKKTTSSITGTISIKYNVVVGVKPMSTNAV